MSLTRNPCFSCIIITQEVISHLLCVIRSSWNCMEEGGEKKKKAMNHCPGISRLWSNLVMVACHESLEDTALGFSACSPRKQTVANSFHPLLPGLALRTQATNVGLLHRLKSCIRPRTPSKATARTGSSSPEPSPGPQAYSPAQPT